MSAPEARRFRCLHSAGSILPPLTFPTRRSSDLTTAVAPETNAGEGWLILRVALPRLLRRLGRAHAWLDRYTPERIVEAADEQAQIGRAHVCTPVTWPPRMPSSAWKRKGGADQLS